MNKENNCCGYRKTKLTEGPDTTYGYLPAEHSSQEIKFNRITSARHMKINALLQIHFVPTTVDKNNFDNQTNLKHG